MTTTSNPTITIYFSDDRFIFIQNRSFIFHEISQNGETQEVPIIVSQQQNLRRLQAFQEDTVPKYLDRCSFETGVCFHTYDEIVELHSDSRRLQSDPTDENKVTYGEIHANVEILSKDSRSSLSQAQKFLEGVLMNYTDSRGSVTVSFLMSERCVNYDDLVEDCNGYPVPDTVGTSSDFLDNMAPFAGVLPLEGRWVFRDEIEYTIDPYSIQLKVKSISNFFH
jgi:hypothetical protein